MAWAAWAVPLVAGVLGAAGNKQQGRAAERVGELSAAGKEIEAQQFETQAGQEIAASQRASMEERRRARLAASRALAVAAASGGGASDPTVTNIISDIEGEGEYRAGVAAYEGEERARRLRMGARASRFEGLVAKDGGGMASRAYDYKTAGSVLGSAGSLYAKYGMGGPGTNSNAGALDQYQLFSGEGMTDPRFG